MAKTAPLVAILNASPDLMGLLQFILSEEGYTVITMYHEGFTAKDVVAFLDQHQPNAVLMDLPAPYRENWRKCQAVREGLPEVPIIAVAVSPDELTDAAGPNDAFPLFGRPFRVDAVIDVLRRTLGDPDTPVRP